MTATEDRPATTTVRGACPHDCPDTCAMLVTVEDGRATAVRGDPEHPFTRGALCVKVNDYVDRVYSPRRVLHPLRRTGPKGSGEFTRISWDEALDEIAGRFREAIGRHGPETVMPVSYLGTEGVLNGLNVGDPFFNRLGATVTERTYCDSGACTAYTMTIGATAGVDPESLVHSRYIVIWACNVVSTNLHLWPVIAEAQRRGAKVVVIDPVRHQTAARADWHIPIRPGSDGALALALAHVIIGEGLTDEAYVRDHTLGFEELAERVRQYTPEWAEQETGIPAPDIRTLAREYAAGAPSMIRIGVAIERHAGGGQTVRTIACLPALVGAWRRVGGGLLQLPLWAFPVNWGALMHPELITPGTRVVNQYLLGRALTGELGLDPPITALVVYNSNPLVVCPEQEKVAAGLAREDLFTVVSDQFLTDTARHADVVLPATTQLEQLDVMFSWGHFYVSLNTPAVAPLGEAVSNTELFRRLAARMGFTEPCFTRTDEEMVAEAFDWSAPQMQGITVESLRRTGWARLNLPSRDEYAPHADGGFPTPSGRTEFRSSVAEQAGNFVVPLFRQGSDEHQPGGTVDPLPHHVPSREPADPRHPLYLISPKSHAYLNSSAGDMPAQQRVQGEQTVLLHPQDAAERGIVDGQDVRVSNDRGSFVARVRVTDAVVSGVAVCPMGTWRRNSRALATVNAVTPVAFADLGNAPTFSDTRVQVEPA
ncbi:Anaerobic selenocysteine-containing dehydrogenase [Geodermatophilus dictyosporus]|uniref:Anaerobic selenocysteine-containing dehydrogenase n=1 Tax=Geodermatophilus dictyosporus TaxID=1523247 RepID=A0A1I5JK11_9ACTN|nr:molybdopterin oxidoreductase family protein [Geodermatophilus dictyosporus]SFO72883.1 Anaerobic selenocysteine-containing dehydrogenase [Geodermatophilus dictyosporus]